LTTIITPNREKFTAADLKPALDARWVLRPRHLAVCLLFSLVFLLVNTLPLLDWSIWSDVGLGRWMLAHRSLPAGDPTQPMSGGVHVVHTAWLSQLALGAADRLGGPQAVSNLFTALTMAWLAILARVVYGQTQRVGLMLAGIALVLLLGGESILFAGAGVFGTLCLAILLWLLAYVDPRAATGAKGLWIDGSPLRGGSSRGLLIRGPQCLASGRNVGAFGQQSPPWAPAWSVWVGVAGLFALWANLHGSYLLGVAVLASYALARGCKVAWQTKGLRPLLGDASFRIYLLLAGVALVASFANPYGPMLVLENLAVLRGDLLAVHPLDLVVAPQGIVLLASLALLLVLLRVSGRRGGVIDVLLPAVFAAAVLVAPRAQGWYALAYVFVVVPHLAEIANRRFPRNPSVEVAQPLTARSFIFTLLCGLTLYFAFCLAPGTQSLMGGRPRPAGELTGSDDLCEAAEWLRENSPGAFVFASASWSDFLVGRGGDGVTAMLTSNGHWVPEAVRDDHRRIACVAEGWEKALDRYGIDTLVLGREQHALLIGHARCSRLWSVVCETKDLVVLRRKR
jgi:hypothetical protein